MATLSSLSTSAGGALRLLDRRVYTANATWTKPADNAGNILAGVGKIVFVRAIGGGGGGVSGTDPSYAINYYAGGSGAGTSESTFDISQLTPTVTVTVGAGGAANATATYGFNTNTGGIGGNSSFGAYVWAEGGLGGQCAIFGGYVNSPTSLTMGYGVWDIIQMQYFRMGGTGSTIKGSRGAFLSFLYNSSSATYSPIAMPAEKGPGCGGGGAHNIGGSSSGSVPIGSNSTMGTPGPGGTNLTAGGLYGGGGGAANSGAAYAGGVGVVVVETWG